MVSGSGLLPVCGKSLPIPMPTYCLCNAEELNSMGLFFYGNVFSLTFLNLEVVICPLFDWATPLHFRKGQQLPFENLIICIRFNINCPCLSQSCARWHWKRGWLSGWVAGAPHFQILGAALVLIKNVIWEFVFAITFPGTNEWVTCFMWLSDCQYTIHCYICSPLVNTGGLGIESVFLY